MAELSFQSPGVSLREIDLTGPTSIEPTGLPAAIISTTEMGPAFVPMIQPTVVDYTTRFGNPVDNIKQGPLAAFEWLRNQQSLVQVRVLGVGDASKRTSTGNNAGKVTNAGFVVGNQLPQASLSGNLSNNAYANTAGIPGRTYFLGCWMSQSVGSTYLTDAGIQKISMPLIRGVVFSPSGVIPALSTSNATSSPPTSVAVGNFTGHKGFWTGSLKISSGSQQFVMLLNGHKGTDSQYPNVITASFDPTAANYFANVFNKDPLKVEQAGHLLYSFFDVFSAQAIPTGSGFVQPLLGATGSGDGSENIAFLVSGSQARDGGSSTAPNFENFEDRFRTASTPWFISQQFGGSPISLFKVYALSDGEYANGKYKVSIENIQPSNNTVNRYGTFDLLLRKFNDTDNSKVVLEQFRGLSLDPSSNRYIAKLIGDSYTFYNFESANGTQKLQTTGEFANRSKYVRVEMSSLIQAGEVDETALPMGFRGIQHFVTSGSAPMPSFSDSNYYVSTRANIFNDLVQPPIPLRQTITKGSGSNASADNKLYWGVQYERVGSATEPNSSNISNNSLENYAKYYPNFQTTSQDFAVSSNEGTADTAANPFVDCDRFNNNLFTLERLKIKYNSTTDLPDITNLKDWAYVRQGGISKDTTLLTRALTASDLSETSVRFIAKFTVHMEGGFDGTNTFNSDAKYLTNLAVIEEMSNASRGLASGPTVKAYTKAIEIISDTMEVDCQLLVIPGIRHSFITDTATSAMENDRFDCMYIMDIEEKDIVNSLVTNATQDVSVRFTTTAFRTRGLNSSFAAAYFPDVTIQDSINRTTVRVAPSVAVLGAFGYNDAVAYPWNAAAGFTRGALSTVESVNLSLSRKNLDDCYSVNINPIASFSGQMPTVWGQKTVLASKSALERVNVRRLLLSLRRDIKKVGQRIMFQPNRDTTLELFNSQVDPILKRAQDAGGLDSYQVRIDTSITTTADVENKTIRGKILLVPTRTLEFLDLSFVVTNRGSFASG